MLLDKAWWSDGWKMILNVVLPSARAKVPRDEFLPRAIREDAATLGRSCWSGPVFSAHSRASGNPAIIF
jgi:hypothetical protein